MDKIYGDKFIFWGLGFCIYEWRTYGDKSFCIVTPNYPWWRPKELMYRT